MRSLTLTLFLSVLLPLYTNAQNTGYPATTEIGIDEKLDTYIPKNIHLFNQDGDTVTIGTLINKPTVISFVYYRCPGLCSPLMNGIAEVITKSDLKIGSDYQVLTISFDDRETPELARRKRVNYLSQISKPGAENGWFFFTGDSADIALITDAAGFRYKRSGNDFLHAAGLVVLSPDGKITRYLNGTSFLPFELKMSVIEASKGQSGPTINKILQFCYAYDPQGHQYVLNITRVSGIVIIFMTLGIFLVLILKPLFKRKTVIN